MKADALTKLYGDKDLLRAVCRQAFTVFVEAPEIMSARSQEERERKRVPRVKSPLMLREPLDETSMSVTTTITVTRHETLFAPCCLPRHQAIGSRTSLRDQCFLFCLCTHCCRSERSVPLLPLCALLQSFVARSALVPLQSVAIPETVLSV